ncbi:MAG: type II toxin-antitoxin system VapC family toxin [Desulfobacterales bacterium]|nr:type II toxin-antitoxin system VapC family toxin [Desulfobacterales bacterium]
MVEAFTIDSSVIVASLLEQEREHLNALSIWREVITGNAIAIMPYTVLVEVVAAVRRRTGQKELAQKVKEELLSTDTVNFVIIDPESASDASDIAIELGVRGMDAVVIQTAKEHKTTLVSLDKEMTERSATIVKIRVL